MNVPSSVCHSCRLQSVCSLNSWGLIETVSDTCNGEYVWKQGNGRKKESVLYYFDRHTHTATHSPILLWRSYNIWLPVLGDFQLTWLLMNSVCFNKEMEPMSWWCWDRARQSSELSWAVYSGGKILAHTEHTTSNFINTDCILFLYIFFFFKMDFLTVLYYLLCSH